ncbi:Ornithine carbamoyltransferase [compost metagenome]
MVASARDIAQATGAVIEVLRDPREAVKDADVIYTDVWASMGFEEEQKAREAAFASYQVDEELAGYAKPDYLFMHCLPAHRGEEVSEGVIDGEHSIIFDQAENRLHAQKALMAALMG